jgi:hypothetical protein
MALRNSGKPAPVSHSTYKAIHVSSFGTYTQATIVTQTKAF